MYVLLILYILLLLYKCVNISYTGKKVVTVMNSNNGDEELIPMIAS